VESGDNLDVVEIIVPGIVVPSILPMDKPVAKRRAVSGVTEHKGSIR